MPNYPPAFLLAPGAGAPSIHPRMRTFGRLLGSLGHVEPFDYPYVLERRRRPDALPRLIEAHRTTLAAVRAKHDGPIVLAGKSLGSRVGCHVALVDQVDALICFGYPFLRRSDRSKLRDQVLLELKTPILFVQGTRDPMCPLDLLEDVRFRMDAPSVLFRVEGGDHSLLVSKTALKASGSNQEEADDKIRNAVAGFLKGTLNSPPPDESHGAPLR